MRLEKNQLADFELAQSNTEPEEPMRTQKK